MKDLGRLHGGLLFEDLELGTKWHSAGRTITEADLVASVNLSWFNEELFTNMYDRAGRAIAGRPVPGALVFGMAEGLIVSSIERAGLAFLNADMNMKHPTQVGDTIYVHCEVIESRAVSKPDRGLVRTENTVVRADGTPLMAYRPLRLVRRRHPLEAAGQTPLASGS